MPAEQSPAFREGEKTQQLTTSFLYILQHGADVVYLAYSDRDIVVEGMPPEKSPNDPQTFTKAQLQHTSPDQGVEAKDTDMTLTVAIQENEFGRKLRELFLYSSPKKTLVTIIRAHRKDGNLSWDDDCQVAYQCIAMKFVFRGPIVSIALESVLRTQNGNVPQHFWIFPCQHKFGDQTVGNCGLNIDADPFRLETEILSTTRAGKTITIGNTTIDGSPITATTFQGGKVWTLDGGGNMADSFQIISTQLLPLSAGVKLYLAWWGISLVNGADIKVFRGCNRSKAQCLDYGNLDNYGGFPFIPSVSPSVNGMQ